MIHFIFDVDGTLTPSRQLIDSDFKSFFIDFCVMNKVYLVTGSDYAKTQEQLNDYLLQLAERVYCCSGNEVWSSSKCISKNNWKLPDDVRTWLLYKLDDSKFELKTGLHIEERTGCINFSIVGRNADLLQRKLYIKYDVKHDERKRIANDFNNMFPELEARLGGETGLDIYEKGKDKSQILKDFNSEDVLYFFGDKIEPDGNDFPLANAIDSLNTGRCFSVRDWRETYKWLKNIQKEQV